MSVLLESDRFENIALLLLLGRRLWTSSDVSILGKGLILYCRSCCWATCAVCFWFAIARPDCGRPCGAAYTWLWDPRLPAAWPVCALPLDEYNGSGCFLDSLAAVPAPGA